MSSDRVFLFAYGTIQPGFGNYRGGLSVGNRFPGSVYGHIYWVADEGSYPVAKLVTTDDESPFTKEIVKGTWIEVDTSSRVFQDITEMEIYAGYCVVPVEDVDLDIQGIGYHYRHPIDSKVKIESGDWAKEILAYDLHS